MAVFVALSLGFAATLVAVAQIPASASCVGPQISVDEPDLVPGGMVTVRGEYFGTACNDTGGPGPVLGQPATGITIWLQTSADEFPLGTVDADCNYQFVAIGMVPIDAAAGAAGILTTRDGYRSLPVDVQLVESDVSRATIPSTTVVYQSAIDCKGDAATGSRSVTNTLVTIVVISALVAVTALAVDYGRKRPNRPDGTPHR